MAKNSLSRGENVTESNKFHLAAAINKIWYGEKLFLISQNSRGDIDKYIMELVRRDYMYFSLRRDVLQCLIFPL